VEGLTRQLAERDKRLAELKRQVYCRLVKDIMTKRQLRIQKLTLVARIKMANVMIIITMTRR
jgi:hypothetical protein